MKKNLRAKAKARPVEGVSHWCEGLGNTCTQIVLNWHDHCEAGHPCSVVETETNPANTGLAASDGLSSLDTDALPGGEGRMPMSDASLEVRVSARWCGVCQAWGDHHTDRHSAPDTSLRSVDADSPKEDLSVDDKQSIDASLEVTTKLNSYTEGDARTKTHAKACSISGPHPMSCRCWCHGITRHPNGALRPDSADQIVEYVASLTERKGQPRTPDPASPEVPPGCGKLMGFSGDFARHCGDFDVPFCRDCMPKTGTSNITSSLADEKLDAMLDRIAEAIEDAAGEFYSTADGDQLVWDFAEVATAVRRGCKIEAAAQSIAPWLRKSNPWGARDLLAALDEKPDGS